MRRTILLLATMALTLLVASGVVLGAGIGSAGAQSSVVGPGESIQKAINAAHPGDTIVVRGVHREDVVIRKNGIKLRGEDAVIEAPPRAKADSPCSRTFGPEAICVLGDVNLQTEKLTGPRVSDVSVSGFTIRGFKIAGNEAFVIDVTGARNATVVGNRATGNVASGIVTAGSVNTTVANNHVIGSPETFLGVFVVDSPRTKILSNDVSRSGNTGIAIFGPGRANNDAKVVGNRISGGPWGIWVAGAHRGSFAGNTIHDNCAGMFFEALPSQPVGDFEVKGNTVENNTRKCPAGLEQGREAFSGIGIALLGASGMEVTGNQISGNIPSGPTPVSGGVVVSTNPFFGGTPKPMNNSVIGNHFGRNKPDIFWDDSGSGNSFLGNLCDTSVPSRLCN
jgi:parallel beta-helix repeat protein